MPYTQNVPPVNIRQHSLTSYIPPRPISPLMYPKNPRMFAHNQNQIIPGSQVNEKFRSRSGEKNGLGNFVK